MHRGMHHRPVADMPRLLATWWRDEGYARLAVLDATRSRTSGDLLANPPWQSSLSGLLAESCQDGALSLMGWVKSFQQHLGTPGLHSLVQHIMGKMELGGAAWALLSVWPALVEATIRLLDAILGSIAVDDGALRWTLASSRHWLLTSPTDRGVGLTVKEAVMEVAAWCKGPLPNLGSTDVSTAREAAVRALADAADRLRRLMKAGGGSRAGLIRVLGLTNSGFDGDGRHAGTTINGWSGLFKLLDADDQKARRMVEWLGQRNGGAHRASADLLQKLVLEGEGGACVAEARWQWVGGPDVVVFRRYYNQMIIMASCSEQLKQLARRDSLL